MSTQEPDPTDDVLLSDEELREMTAEADQILAQPAQRYDYRDPNYKGGPRKVDDDTLLGAAVEMMGVTNLIDQLEDQLAEAKILRIQICEHQMNAGIPVEFIAKTSGYKHRASVYRAIESLPKLMARRGAASDIASKIRRAGT